MLAGEEMLKSKNGESNSYNCSDKINNLDWQLLKPGSKELEMFTWYKNLIQLRNDNPKLWNTDISCNILENHAIEVTYKAHGATVGFAVVNPTSHSFFSPLPAGSWKVLLDGERFNTNEILKDRVCVPAYGVILQIKN